MSTIPVLFDTDIGNDIDDAVALAYLLRQPRCELLGITTVTGNTVQRAAIADAVCRADGRTDIPIFAGLTGPLLHGPGQPQVPQYAVLQGTDHRADFGTGPTDAILFLRDTIRARPQEVTLLGVGPMTNIAALFALDPEIPSLLKQVVLMCGVFTGGLPHHGPGTREWNALIDPTATGIVYQHAAPQSLLSVGLDVTRQCTLSVEECHPRFVQAGGALAFVMTLADAWFKSWNEPNIIFHDPLAAALIFEPDICAIEHGRVSVWTNNDSLAGMTLWHQEACGPHRIATTVDREHFLSHYFSVTAT